MKKIDMAIARTMQQAILLVTMGTDPDKGGVNQKNLAAMQTLFTNESVGRVLIADYTTKAEFVVPRIADLLTPSKYEIFDRDIRMGLNNILFGEGEKFADTSVKVKIFIERLKQARETFIDEFLFPEIKTICKNLGFKNYPTPYFEDIDLRDGLSYARIYTRLVELGLLTQEEAVSALETGKLPTTEESIESQEKFKKLKDSGLYQPIIGGAKTETEDEDEEDEEDVKKPNGRPEGSDGNPQEVEREPSDNMDSAPTINATELYSLEKIKSNLILAGQLNSEVEKSLREKHSVKRMTNKQKEVAQGITELIMANENPEDWKSKINIYIENPKDSNKERVNDINEIAAKHQVDSYLASILRASTKE
jgi:NCAIR mutase (PurE)-related protein